MDLDVSFPLSSMYTAAAYPQSALRNVSRVRIVVPDVRIGPVPGGNSGPLGSSANFVMEEAHSAH